MTHEQGQLSEQPREQSEVGQDDSRRQLTFEQALARLEEIVDRLEGGEAVLEDSLRLFEEGVGLARFCREQLDRAEERIRVLVDGEEGERERQIAAGLEDEIGLGTGDDAV